MKIKRVSELLDEDVPVEWRTASVCYGHFDVIHPGHLRYFQTARSYGNPLIVAIEGDAFTQRSGDKIMYLQSDRAQGVASIEFVDQVVILDTADLETLITLAKPSALVLGREFEHERFYEVRAAIGALEASNGKVVYEVGETRYAGTNLILQNMEDLESLRESQFRKILNSRKIDIEEIALNLKENTQSRILVIGDTIIDRFVACDPVGMSNEAPVVVVKEINEMEFLGGAGIVAAHVSALGADSFYLSVVGNDVQAETVRHKLNDFSVENCLVVDPSRPTTNKIRYLVENQKLFRVSQLKEHAIPTDVEDKVKQKIIELAPTLSAIVVCDFVYGVITSGVIDSLMSVSKQYDIPLFGDLQCSSQVGDVSKFKEFHLLTPTEREARIALSNQHDSVEYVANALLSSTAASNLLLKIGAEGVIAYSSSDEDEYYDRQHFPALCTNPIDVAGAGDAMLAVVATMIASGCSLMEAVSIATVASCIAVKRVGNLPISYSEILNYCHNHNLLVNVEA